MDSSELRKKFLDFFEKHGHTIVPSSSLLPTDPSVLFTTAGMQQFKPYYLGEKSPYGNSVASCQKCFRTSDIEEVGDERHLTFFEMLGNFSFGGYFKEEAIKLAKEFLDELKIEIDYVTVFQGDENTSRDEESAKIWGELGFSESKGNLRFENKKENFWGPTGEEGPCGPTTEIYSGGIEIWNIVFNQYYQNKDKTLKNLEVFGIDTGMGLERLAMVTQKTETVFETDLFEPIIKLIPEKANFNERKKRIIADHSRSIAFLISDGVRPSNKEQGYVLRRLIRRVTAYEFSSKMDFFEKLLKKVAGEFDLKQDIIISEFENEKNKFLEMLEKGILEYSKIKDIDAKSAFFLFQSFGLPFDIIKELDLDKSENLKQENFENELKKHQELSRTASAGMFKGGLADSSFQTTKLHTAAHLMLAGLRKVLGEHVAQKGSNITAERLRFDFSHNEKMTSGQIKDVENFVNGIIEKDLPVSFEEMTLERAKELGAIGVFESKYGERVKVYTLGSGNEIVSREICGGPHVERAGILGHFKIQKEESSSSGVRRIKAILE